MKFTPIIKTRSQTIKSINESIKCELDENQNVKSQINLPNHSFVIDCAIQCDLPTSCKDLRCAETRELVDSLKTTIEVLEAELQCLRTQQKSGDCRDVEQEKAEWTVHHHKKRQPFPISENRYQPLNVTSDDVQQQPKPLQQKMPYQRKNRRGNLLATKHPILKPITPYYKSKQKVGVSFSSVLIEGDSHSRGIASLVQQMLGDGTKVTGDCKPGAKLLKVVSDLPPPPDSCCIVIAGTNDVAEGQQKNIYAHLERLITTKLKTAKVVVSTLPYRHDLPTCHPLHLETALVNAYIEELCARHRWVEVLDFNHIDRRAFSKQGMHLKPKSKQQLAKRLLECLQKLDESTPQPPTVHQPPTSPPARRPPQSIIPEVLVAAEPRILQHDTFADALKFHTGIRSQLV